MTAYITSKQLFTCKLGGQKLTHSARQIARQIAHPPTSGISPKTDDFQYFLTTKPLTKSIFYISKCTKIHLHQRTISKKSGLTPWTPLQKEGTRKEKRRERGWRSRGSRMGIAGATSFGLHVVLWRTFVCTAMWWLLCTAGRELRDDVRQELWRDKRRQQRPITTETSQV